MADQKTKRGDLQSKVQFVKGNYADKHLTKVDAVKGLQEKFGISKNFARTVVYSYCMALSGFAPAEAIRRKHVIQFSVDIGSENAEKYDQIKDQLIDLLSKREDVLNVEVRLIKRYNKKK